MPRSLPQLRGIVLGWPFAVRLSILALFAGLLCFLAVGNIRWQLPPGNIDKLNHALAAGALNGAAMLLFGRRYAATCGVIVFVGLIEVAQMWIPWRTTSLADFAASVGGALLVVALVEISQQRAQAGTPPR